MQHLKECHVCECEVVGVKQLTLALPTHVGAVFDNFVPGRNLDCLSYLQDAVAQLKLKTPAPTYLWGEHGCGKTHLLQSVARAVEEYGELYSGYGWLSSTQALGDFNPNWAAILIDDCEQLDEQAQASAFRAFVDAQTHGVWVVAAGALPPVDLPVREDLRTRLGWGDIFAMKTLTDEELQAALWQAFRSRGLALSEDVKDYVLHHFPRDMTSLMHLLGELDQYSLASKRAITIPLIKSMLGDSEYAKKTAPHFEP